jgi:hypothetical protein
MGNCLLEPRNYFVHGTHSLLGLKAFHFISEPYVDSAIPEPSNPHVDFAVVNPLKLDRKVGHDDILFL